MSVVDCYLCPITRQFMMDPYIDNEGNSYELEAIEKWLLTNQTSPITRNPLYSYELKPNRALKEIIQNYLLLNPINISPNNVIQKIDFPVIDENPLNITVNSINYNYSKFLKISINPVDNMLRSPLDLVVVIDVSCSMNDYAKVEINGVLTNVGFTVLDITKHAIKVIIENLRKNVDRISIITFSDVAKIILNLTTIDDTNINYIHSLVSSLKTEGATNIWAGLNVGLTQFITDNNINSDNNHIKSLLFMTDGIPSDHLLPPRGIIDTLKTKLSQFPINVLPSIHTFGFGYNLDTNLLVNISKCTDGYFSFIPDSGFVGTVIINYFANLLTTVATHTNLYLKNIDNSKIKILGYSNNEKIPLNSIHNGQPRNIIIELKDNITDFNIVLSFVNNLNKVKEIDYKIVLNNIQPVHYNNIINDIIRLEFIDTLNKILTNHYLREDTNNFLNNFIYEFYDNYKDTNILKDAMDQVKIAISNQYYYNKWGKNYLNSLMSANLNCRCNNFKDLSVSEYGGNLFKAERDIIDNVFSNMDPPVPSVVVKDNDGRRGSSSTNINMTTFRMSSYNDSSIGCIHENSRVHLFDGTFKKCSEIKAGDVVKTLNNRFATIICVIKNKCKDNTVNMVCFDSGLMITPYHPINYEKYWCFPVSIHSSELVESHYVYNFILDTNHNVIINDIPCITLGHHYGDTVLYHHYFGTNKVINDLAKCAGFTKGLITFDYNSIIRDYNNIVVGYDLTKELIDV